jgi:predicted phage terminase large subunit-like protein
VTYADIIEEVEAIEAELARRSLRAFVEAAWPIVEPDTPFKANWHIDALCRKLEQVTKGDVTRLLVNIPPGTSKSLIVSVFWPAWEWATHPPKRFLCASYGESLAVRDNLKVRTIVESQWYRRHFALRLKTDQNAKQRFDTIQTGWRIGTSVGGRATGEHPDYIIIDDPHSAAEAQSEAERQSAIDWFDMTISPRGVGRGVRFVVIMQRLHEVDLSGHLLAKGGWDHVCWPMRFEPDRKDADDPRTVPGELLWPEQFTETKVAQLERDLGSYGAAGQLQQRPVPGEGGLIKRHWFRWYTPGLKPAVSRIVISADLALRAKETNDYSAIGVWGEKGPDVYGLKSIRGRWDYPELIRQIRSLHQWAREQWPFLIPEVIVENAGAGPEAVAELRQTIPGVIAEMPKGDKVQRVHAVLPLIEAGNVWLPGAARPDGHVDRSLKDLPEWVPLFLDECSAFPLGANDDQVDQMTQALRRLHRPKGGAGFADLSGL